MGNLVFQAALGGQVAVSGPNTASSYTIAVPTVSGTFVTTGDTATVTSTMISGPLTSAVGGTGVNNGSSTLTMGGSVTYSGAYTQTWTRTGNTSLTLPTSGTLQTTTGSLASNTGLPLTTGVTGTLPVANGGTNLTSFTANGVVYASSTSALATGSAFVFDGTNVGIGTSSPSTYGNLAVVSSSGTLVAVKGGASANQGGNFSVVKAGSSANLALFGDSANQLGGTPDAAVGIYTASSVPLLFNVGGSEKARFTTAGYLGIGTSSPTAPLTIAGTAATTSQVLNSTGSTTGATYGRWFNTGSDLIWGIESSAGGVLLTGSSAYSAVLYTNSAVSLQFGTAGTVKATLDSSGNLGLGVTPSAWSTAKAFQVYNASMYSTGGNTFLANNYYYNGSNNIYIQNSYATALGLNSGQFQFFVAPSGTAGGTVSFTQAMTLDNSGNLLIGATGVLNSSKLGITFNGNTFNGITLNDSASAFGTGFQYFEISGTNIGSIIRVGSTSAVVYNTTSDQRLKSNIEDAISVLDKLMQVKVRQYDWTEGDLHQDYGFIAQELEPVLSGIVTKGKTEKDMWQLDYSRLTPHLVKAIQELSAKVTALEAKLGV